MDHIYVNHSSLFATRRRVLLSTPDNAIIGIIPKFYSKEHHQAFTRRSCRMIKQRVLAPSNIANYQSKTGQKQHLSHVYEQISEEIRRIDSLVTRKLLAPSTPQNTWRILRLQTGERASSIVNVEISLNEFNTSFIHDRDAL